MLVEEARNGEERKMKWHCAALYGVMFMSVASAEEPRGEAGLYKGSNDVSMPYRLFTPMLEAGRSYPIVLCFHGAAGRGTDNMTKGTLAYQVLTSEESQKQHPAFVLAPQCPADGKWVNHRWGDGAYDSSKVAISEPMTLALAILDEVIAKYPIDKNRIYVTGRSMGGFATWDAIARRPDFFAAAIPIAGGGDPGMAEQWKNLPIWTVASAGDGTCPVEGTRVVVEALKKVKANIRYTEDPKKSHGEICNAWRDVDGLGDWLFEQRKMRSRSANDAWNELLPEKEKKGAMREAFAYVENNAELPNVLLYGDSISIMYTMRVRTQLKDKANVYRLHANGNHSGKFIELMTEMHDAMRNAQLDSPWAFQWDVIHFNVGLHDLKYVLDGKMDKVNGIQVSSVDVYKKNLRAIVEYLHKLAPKAKLVFATTTPVPDKSEGRVAVDAARYNDAAREVLKDYPDVLIDDLYSLAKPNQEKWWLSPVNVHFNTTGCDALGDKVAESILEAMSKRSDAKDD